MKRLRATAIAAALAGCLHGTTTPGVKRCVRYFIVIGFVTECEEGPPWARGVDPPDSSKPGVVEPVQQPATVAPTEPAKPPVPGGDVCFYVTPEPTKHAERRCAGTIEQCRAAAKAVRPPAEVTIDCDVRRE